VQINSILISVNYLVPITIEVGFRVALVVIVYRIVIN
jgi:hypothetical protein